MKILHGLYIEFVEICPWYQDSDHVFTDEDSFIDWLDIQGYTDEQVEEILKKETTKAICVFTEAGEF